jgi:hypothetical protein
LQREASSDNTTGSALTTVTPFSIALQSFDLCSVKVLR